MKKRFKKLMTVALSSTIALNSFTPSVAEGRIPVTEEAAVQDAAAETVPEETLLADVLGIMEASSAKEASNEDEDVEKKKDAMAEGTDGNPVSPADVLDEPAQENSATKNQVPAGENNVGEEIAGTEPLTESYTTEPAEPTEEPIPETEMPEATTEKTADAQETPEVTTEAGTEDMAEVVPDEAGTEPSQTEFHEEKETKPEDVSEGQTECQEAENMTEPADTETETEWDTEAREEMPGPEEDAKPKGEETELEQEETKAATLISAAKQESFVEADGTVAVKHTIKVTSQGADTENIEIKAVIDRDETYYSGDGETPGLYYILGTEGPLPLDELADVPPDQMAEYTSAAVWGNQAIKENAEKEYIFFTHIGADVPSADVLDTMFFVNGEKVTDVRWENDTLIRPLYAVEHSYVWKGDGATMNAEVPEGARLPYGTEFTVARMDAGSESYKAAIKAVEATDQGLLYLDYAAYDLSFLADGEPVEPEGGCVKVEMGFDVPALSVLYPEAAAEDEIRMFHVIDGYALPVEAQIAQNGNMAVTAVSFESGSFSPYILARVAEKKDRTFTYEDDQVAITVDVPKEVKLAHDVKLRASAHADKSSEYEESVAMVEKSEGREIGSALVYDVGFYAGDEEVEPEDGAVKVTFEFKGGTMMGTGGKPGIDVFHLTEDDVEKIHAKASISRKGEVKSADFSVGSFSTFVVPLNDRVLTTNAAYLKNGGSYALGYIFSNFNVFVQGNYTGTHVVGPVAVGGETSLNYFGGAISGVVIPHKVSSYFAGTLNLYDREPEAPGKMGYVTSSKVPLYFGMGNMDTVHATFESKERGSASLDYYTDSYLDFKNAFASIANQTSGYQASVKIDFDDLRAHKMSTQEIKRDGYSYRYNWSGVVLSLPMGHSYELEDTVLGTAWDDKLILNYTGAAGAAGTDTIVKISKSGTLKMPETTQIDGQSTSNMVGTEVGTGMGIVYLIPNADNVSANAHLGHMSAPNADVSLSGGNWSGCIVAKELMARPGAWGGPLGSEGHMWPYNGQVLNPDYAAFEINKFVDNDTPDETFSFIMEQVDGPRDSDGNMIYSIPEEGITGQNQGKEVIFDEIEYSDDATGDQPEATYKYAVYEDADSVPDGYTADSQKYYLKVVVKKAESAGGGGISSMNSYDVVSKKFYTNDACTKNEADRISFYNRTSSAEEGGCLKIKKTAGPDTSFMDGEVFLFKVTNEEGLVIGNNDSETWPVIGAGEIEIKNLPPGQYVVTEVDGDGNPAVDSQDFRYEVKGGGEVAVESGKETSITVTNTLKRISISGHKTWRVPGGTRLPDKITVSLLQDGKHFDRLDVTAKDGWKYVFTDLPKYKEGGSTLHEYSIEEMDVPGYVAEIKGYDITNTISQKTVVRGTVHWADDNDKDKIRQPNVTIVLLQDGEEANRAVIGPKDGWEFSFDNLDQYSGDGATRHIYTVEELPVPGYTINPSGEGFDITNVHKSASTNVTDEPETDAQETERPGTEAPDTEAPETENPGTENPGTETPDTESPEIENPETESPDTEKPGTEIPDVEAPETENPDIDSPEAEIPESGANETEAAAEPETGQDKHDGSIRVTKRTTVLGADGFVNVFLKDSVFYVGLFQDAEGTKPYGDGYMKEIRMASEDGSDTVMFSDLKDGTYYIFETDQNGRAIPFDTSQQVGKAVFTCMTDNGKSNKVTLGAGNKKGHVWMNNVYATLPSGLMLKGKLDITKKVLRNGSETTVDDVFYAGVFRKDGNGVLNLVKVVELTQNGTVTVKVPLGGTDGTEPAEYYVYETDGAGMPVDKAEFAYDVLGEGPVLVSKEKETTDVTIINSFKEEEEEEFETGTEEETETKPTGVAGTRPKPGKPAASNRVPAGVSPKTGDSTDLALYGGLFAGSAMVILLLWMRKKKRRKEKQS